MYDFTLDEIGGPSVDYPGLTLAFQQEKQNKDPPSAQHLFENDDGNLMPK